MSMNSERFIDSTRIVRSVGVLLTALAVGSLLLRRLLYGDRILTFFADDFFYYAQITRNMLIGAYQPGMGVLSLTATTQCGQRSWSFFGRFIPGGTFFRLSFLRSALLASRYF